MLSHQPDGPYPSCDIATYELARQMADSGYFPNAWYHDDQGNAEPIHDAIAALLDDDHDQLKPLPGARYKQGDVIALAGDNWPGLGHRSRRRRPRRDAPRPGRPVHDRIRRP